MTSSIFARQFHIERDCTHGATRSLSTGIAVIIDRTARDKLNLHYML
jgi:hypothetical protein